MPELQLLDISLPNDLPWYSFSLLTWILTGLVCFSLIGYLFWFFGIQRRSKKHLVFKEIFAKIDAIEFALNQSQIDNHQLAQQVDLLLKRAAKSFLTESETKQLANNELWLEYLNSQVKKNKLKDDFRTIFVKAPYSPDFDYDQHFYLHTTRAYLGEFKKNI